MDAGGVEAFEAPERHAGKRHGREVRAVAERLLVVVDVFAGFGERKTGGSLCSPLIRSVRPSSTSVGAGGRGADAASMFCSRV